MNPDFHKTADYITHTMMHPDGDHTVAFHVYKDHVEIRSSMGPSRVSLEEARKAWKELVRRGFTLSNKCVHHNMKKFNRAKRREEEAMKQTMHYADLQEMRINPKDFYKNYALEA